MTARKAISKRVRFEVFKRDRFTCQYCGAHPPGVLLHIDHITAVASGGTNEIDNLITACEPCNAGKGARALTDVPKSLQDKAVEIAEREAQLEGYQSILDAKRERIESEMWQIADTLEPGSPERGFNRANLQSIRVFIERLGFHEVLNAAEIATARFPRFGNKTFRYFCGVCWKKIKDGGS